MTTAAVTQLTTSNDNPSRVGVANRVAPVAVKNEQSLIEGAKQGDHRAFTTLLECYDRQVMKLILRFTGDRYDRDDLYQEIFTACYVALPKFSGKSTFYTWLYRISLNHCISYMRKKRPLEEEQEVPISGPNWEQREQLKAVLKALDNLKGPQRISFHLFYIEQWTVKEITQILECNAGSVKSHLDRARKKIRRDTEVAQWLISI